MANRPKSAALKVVQGTYRVDRANGHVPIGPELEDTRPPPGLDYHGKAAWNRNVPVLIELGILRQNHLDALFAYCDAFSQLRRAQKDLRITYTRFREMFPEAEYKDFAAFTRTAMVARKSARNDMRLFAAEFGMTPVSEGRLEIEKPKDESPFEKLKRDKKRAKRS